MVFDDKIWVSDIEFRDWCPPSILNELNKERQSHKEQYNKYMRDYRKDKRSEK